MGSRLARGCSHSGTLNVSSTIGVAPLQAAPLQPSVYDGGRHGAARGKTFQDPLIINKLAAIPEGFEQLMALGSEDEAYHLSNCLRGMSINCMVATLPTTGDWISVLVSTRQMTRASLVLAGWNARGAAAR